LSVRYGLFSIEVPFIYECHLLILHPKVSDIIVSVLYTVTADHLCCGYKEPTSYSEDRSLSDIKVQFLPHSKWNVSYYEKK